MLNDLNHFHVHCARQLPFMGSTARAMFSAGKLREWRGRFFRPVGWPCRPRCTLAELYLQLQRGESVSLHFFRRAKPLPMDNLRKSGVEREPWISLADSPRLDNVYITDTQYQISQLGIENSSAVLHPNGTVVLSRDAGVGKSAI